MDALTVDIWAKEAAYLKVKVLGQNEVGIIVQTSSHTATMIPWVNIQRIEAELSDLKL